MPEPWSQRVARSLSGCVGASWPATLFSRSHRSQHRRWVFALCCGDGWPWRHQVSGKWCCVDAESSLVKRHLFENRWPPSGATAFQGRAKCVVSAASCGRVGKSGRGRVNASGRRMDRCLGLCHRSGNKRAAIIGGCVMSLVCPAGLAWVRQVPRCSSQYAGQRRSPC